MGERKVVSCRRGLLPVQENDVRIQHTLAMVTLGLSLGFGGNSQAAEPLEPSTEGIGAETDLNPFELEAFELDAYVTSCSTTSTTLLWAEACIATIKERAALQAEYDDLIDASREARDNGDLDESQRLKEEAMLVRLEMSMIVDQFKFCREMFSKLVPSFS